MRSRLPFLLNIFNLLAPKTPLERPKIAVFKLSVAIGDNKVIIKKPLIATRYSLIISYL